MHIFRIFFLCCISLFLVGCSLPGTQTEGDVTSDNTLLFENDVISILVPKNWSGAKISDIPSPRAGSIVIAYVSPEIKSGFSNNLVILEDSLMRIMTSAKYSELNHIQSTKNYLEYTKLKEEDFTFSDDETSKLYVFEARYNQTTPRMKFVQTARVCGSKVYLLHFSLSLDKNPDNYSELLKSFTCK